MRTLALVGEGRGEVEALPILANRVLVAEQVRGWKVRKEIIRLPRGQLVDESVPSPRRPPLKQGFDRAIALALAGGANALVLVVDADSDCPVSFGPPASAFFAGRIRGGAVMAVREFETWLILNHSPQRLAQAGIKNAESKRDAKKLLGQLVPGYLPTTHQAELTRQVDVRALRARSQSFDKFVRELINATT